MVVERSEFGLDQGCFAREDDWLLEPQFCSHEWKLGSAAGLGAASRLELEARGAQSYLD